MRGTRILTSGNVPIGSRRRGTVIVAGIICLVLISALLGSLLNMALSHRRQSRAEQYRLQARWLAESGLERGAARLAEDAAYSKETWNVSETVLGGPHAGTVEISVAPAEDGGGQIVTATARYPLDNVPSAQITKRARVR